MNKLISILRLNQINMHNTVNTKVKYNISERCNLLKTAETATVGGKQRNMLNSILFDLRQLDRQYEINLTRLADALKQYNVDVVNDTTRCTFCNDNLDNRG